MIRILKLTFFIGLLGGGGLVVPVALADVERGLQIAKEMKARELGFDNYTADMKMVLVSSAGKEKVRRLRVKTLEVVGDGEKSLAIFDVPADVKGAAFLSHTHITRADDQWLFLPMLKRVKRIAPANQTAPFMGSEFSYEDLASPEVEKFTYNYLGDEAIDGRLCYKLERFPVSVHSGYSRQVVWVDQQRYVPLKTDYYDRKDRLMKTLITGDYQQYLDRYWRMGVARMENHRSGKHSLLYWSNYRFRQSLSEQDFHPSSLKRMR